MVDYRTLTVGEKLTYVANDFDGTSTLNVTVTAVEDDHAIAEIDGVSMWIDDDTAYKFNK